MRRIVKWFLTLIGVGDCCRICISWFSQDLNLGRGNSGPRFLCISIPGLTYQNSRNVTIEVKISKRGYEDQVKRYNVRQALDQ